ncbi:uncharacterized protein TNCV_768931 [Trichonephila clavipes]|nr:uncharacterized protein TNCV_768931 [Trichonephila clavipes]
MECDAEDCGFQKLTDDEIVTFVQEESDPVDDEMDGDWYWARTRDKASHSPIPIPLCYRGHTTTTKVTRICQMRVFCVRDSHAMVRKTIRVLSYSITAAQENRIPCSEKTKVHNGNSALAAIKPVQEVSGIRNEYTQACSSGWKPWRLALSFLPFHNAKWGLNERQTSVKGRSFVSLRSVPISECFTWVQLGMPRTLLITRDVQIAKHNDLQWR